MNDERPAGTGKMPVGECRLCREYVPLHASHIIPEFLFKPLYDEKHRAILGDVGREVSERTIQKGLRERLFCSACEGVFGELEHHGKEVLAQFLAAVAVAPVGKRIVTVAEADGAKVWRLLLSIVWRAHITANPFFNQVNLGPHEKPIRELLLDQRGSLNDYPCVLAGRRPAEGTGAAIVNPVRTRLGKFITYRFHLPRLTWIAVVSSTPPLRDLEAYVPDAKPGLRGIISKQSEDEFIEKLITKAAVAYRRAGK